jgi:hypothetical protein
VLWFTLTHTPTVTPSKCSRKGMCLVLQSQICGTCAQQIPATTHTQLEDIKCGSSEERRKMHTESTNRKSSLELVSILLVQSSGFRSKPGRTGANQGMTRWDLEMRPDENSCWTHTLDTRWRKTHFTPGRPHNSPPTPPKPPLLSSDATLSDQPICARGKGLQEVAGKMTLGRRCTPRPCQRPSRSR